MGKLDSEMLHSLPKAMSQWSELDAKASGGLCVFPMLSAGPWLRCDVTVYTYSVSIRRAGAFPESQGTESLSTLLTAGGGRARGRGVSDAFRNVISSSLIIPGNTHQTDDFCPCYRYPRPAVPFDWEL